MGRPRRPFHGVEGIDPLPRRFLEGLLPGGIQVRERRRMEASRHWHYKTPNGVFDPLTYLHLLDAVANIDPDIELRSANLTDWLNANMKWFTWDAITVGKVLSDLAEAFEDKLGEKRGILEKGKDYRGNFFRIHHNEDTARLYIRLRADLYRLSELEMQARDRGKASPRLVSPLLECPSVRLEWALPEDEAV